LESALGDLLKFSKPKTWCGIWELLPQGTIALDVRAEEPEHGVACLYSRRNCAITAK